MPELSLHSPAIPLQVEAVLAELLVDPNTPEILRPAPGVRGTELADIAASIFIASSAAANLTTLLLAKDHVSDFAKRLLNAMRRSETNSVELATNINGTKASVRISTSDPEIDLARTLSGLIRAIESGPGVHPESLLRDEPGGSAGGQAE